MFSRKLKEEFKNFVHLISLDEWKNNKEVKGKINNLSTLLGNYNPSIHRKSSDIEKYLCPELITSLLGAK